MIIIVRWGDVRSEKVGYRKKNFPKIFSPIHLKSFCLIYVRNHRHYSQILDLFLRMLYAILNIITYTRRMSDDKVKKWMCNERLCCWDCLQVKLRASEAFSRVSPPLSRKSGSRLIALAHGDSIRVCCSVFISPPPCRCEQNLNFITTRHEKSLEWISVINQRLSAATAGVDG